MGDAKEEIIQSIIKTFSLFIKNKANGNIEKEKK
jgi:hypothetical protein